MEEEEAEGEGGSEESVAEEEEEDDKGVEAGMSPYEFVKAARELAASDSGPLCSTEEAAS